MPRSPARRRRARDRRPPRSSRPPCPDASTGAPRARPSRTHPAREHRSGPPVRPPSRSAPWPHLPSAPRRTRGLGSVISALKQVRGSQGELRLAAPNQQARVVLELTTLDRVFRYYATVEEALTGF